MKDDKAERLLKIAEKDPELAHKIADFMNEGNGQGSSSGEPLAVKVVKDEEDKIEITPAQKKYAIGYVVCVATGMLSIVLYLIIFFSSLHSSSMANSKNLFICTMFIVTVSIIFSGFCAYKSGMPTIKKYLSKHITW